MPQPPSAILTSLLNELVDEREQKALILLILDDYQVIEEPVIDETPIFWLEHLPPHVYLALASHVDPDLPLARGGRLAEIRDADLRFREVEASSFLAHMLEHSPSEEEVSRLTSRTEG